MTKSPKLARTFSEWWQPRYVREHRVVGVSIGFLLGAILWPLVVTLLPAKMPPNVPWPLPQLGQRPGNR